MCMSMNRRLQLLLDEDRYQKVAAIAAREQRSVASVVREAIDRALSPEADRRAAAGRAILEADPAPVPDVDDLRAELAGLHLRTG